MMERLLIFIAGCIVGLAAAPWLYFMIVKRFERSDARERAKHIAALLLIVIGLTGCSSTAITKVEVRERPDSLLVRADTIRVIEVRSDTVYVDRLDTTIIQINPAGRDTIRIVGYRGVRAHIDTTVDGVSVFAEYEYPPDRWRVDVVGRDTIIRWTVRDSIIQRPYEVRSVPLWVYLAIGGMALALIAVLFKR